MAQRQMKTLTDAFVVFMQHPSPILLIALIILFATLRISTAVYPQSIELWGALVIILYWPFQEWWMHKILLHLPPLKWRGNEYEMNFARVHRLHHLEPKNLTLTFLPLSAILVSLFVFSSLFYYCTHQWMYTCTWMCTASCSTLLYEWTHYLTHTDYKPRGRYYRRIWKLHRLHHYKNEQYWFSFTIPWIDQWLGTGPLAKEVPHSPTARLLRPSSSPSRNTESSNLDSSATNTTSADTTS